MAESYEVLLVAVRRLERELGSVLGDGEAWSRGGGGRFKTSAQLQSSARRNVGFVKEVKGRWIAYSDSTTQQPQVVYKDFTLPLTNDRKRTNRIKLRTAPPSASSEFNTADVDIDVLGTCKHDLEEEWTGDNGKSSSTSMFVFDRRVR